MEAIIKISKEKIGNEIVNSVLASELYRELEVKRSFSHWITDNIKRINLIENIDYLVFVKNDKNPKGGRPFKEYVLTLDSAKHIAMMSGTKKGFEVREYFIQIEKEYQIKLLQGSQKYKTLLESEKSKNTNLSLQLTQCKDKLEAVQKEKNYIKTNALLKFQDMDLEVSKAINQFKALKLKSLNIKPIPQDVLFTMIDSLLTMLSLHSQIMAKDFQ